MYVECQRGQETREVPVLPRIRGLQSSPLILQILNSSNVSIARTFSCRLTFLVMPSKLASLQDLIFFKWRFLSCQFLHSFSFSLFIFLHSLNWFHSRKSSAFFRFKCYFNFHNFFTFFGFFSLAQTSPKLCLRSLLSWHSRLFYPVHRRLNEIKSEQATARHTNNG